jgi:DNA gyrase subunit A
VNNDRVSLINVEDEMRESYLSYAMSVIASRALPDVRDGLKPVQRRILYAMRDMGMTPDKQHRKSAGVIGEVLKNYHPHGDSSVYDALVRMAQDFTLRYPLIDGHGNFGSIDPDPPAAYRYTEARLARPAMDMLVDIDKETVDFVPNFDNQGTEPVVLPARLPQLLINGSSGIAVGMATNIPPHNIGEICDAIVKVIDYSTIDGARAAAPTVAQATEVGEAPESGDDSSRAAGVDQLTGPDADLWRELLEIVKGPDFPTGGILMGREAIRTAYLTGRGSVPLRGKAEIIEEDGKTKILITEVPFQVSVNRILEAISDAHEEKRIVGISRLDNESNRHGMRIVVQLARSATPNVVLNQLYKQTPLQSSFAFNMLALVPATRADGSAYVLAGSTQTQLEPKVLSLLDILRYFIEHRKEVVTRRTRYELGRARTRAHLLLGFLVALDNIDRVITIIRESDTVETAREHLIAEPFALSDAFVRMARIAIDENFRLSAEQAAAIVDMRLRTLVGLERQKIEDEHSELVTLIAQLEELLASEAMILEVVKTETLDVRKRFGDARKTPVEALEGELSIEDIIADTDVVITSTVGGYIKRVSVDTFRQQNRGGRGVVGIANLKKEDVVANFFVATTHQHVLFFTNKGRAYRLRAYEIPDSTRQSRGTALVNLLTLPPGESVTAVFPIRDFDGDNYLVMVTRQGVIKKTKLEEFSNVRRNGLNAIGLDDADELLGVDLSNGSRDIILATHDGMAVHFNETDVRPMGRNARGVRAITLAPSDTVVAMDVVEDDRREVLIVTSQAYGKRTPIDDYRHTSRGGKGVKAFAKEKEIGYVVDQILVRSDDELLLITSGNQVIRIPVDQIRRAGRSTKGVRLQRLAEGDEVIAIANLGQVSKRVADITGEEPVTPP